MTNTMNNDKIVEEISQTSEKKLDEKCHLQINCTDCHEIIKKHTYGTISMIIGVLSICFHWLVIFPENFGLFFYIVVLALSIFSIVLGILANNGTISSLGTSLSGRTGAILGILAIVLSTVWLLIFPWLIRGTWNPYY